MTASRTEETLVYKCSNPACGAIWATDPHRPCPACTKLESHGWTGWSTTAWVVRKVPADFEEHNVPEWDRPRIGLPS